MSVTRPIAIGLIRGCMHFFFHSRTGLCERCVSRWLSRIFDAASPANWLIESLIWGRKRGCFSNQIVTIEFFVLLFHVDDWNSWLTSLANTSFLFQQLLWSNKLDWTLTRIICVWLLSFILSLKFLIVFTLCYFPIFISKSSIKSSYRHLDYLLLFPLACSIVPIVISIQPLSSLSSPSSLLVIWIFRVCSCHDFAVSLAQSLPSSFGTTTELTKMRR